MLEELKRKEREAMVCMKKKEDSEAGEEENQVDQEHEIWSGGRELKKQRLESQLQRRHRKAGLGVARGGGRAVQVKKGHGVEAYWPDDDQWLPAKAVEFRKGGEILVEWCDAHAAVKQYRYQRDAWVRPRLHFYGGMR